MSGLILPSRHEVATDLKQAIRSLIVEYTSDDIVHAEVVAMGAFTFRQAFVKDLGVLFNGNRIHCDDLANVVFAFFDTEWDRRHPEIKAKVFLDKVRPIPPPTEAEIEDSWELEIASDERALTRHYEGSARTRKGSDLGVRPGKPEEPRR